MTPEEKKEAQLERHREYYRENKDKWTARQSTPEWHEKNRAKAKKNREGRTPEQQAAYLDYQRNYRATNREALRQKNRERAKQYTAEEKLDWALRQYGLTAETFKRMTEEQGGRCAICRRQPDEQKRLVVDHCHTTGRVRGLLCGQCNCMLGNAKDNTDTLKQAIHYLEVPHNDN